MKTKLVLFIILLSLCTNILAALSRDEEQEEEDPELTTCLHQCGQQQQYSKSDKRAYVRSCKRYHQIKKEREEEEGTTMENQNPYVFDNEDFRTRLDTQDRRVQDLNKFTRRSKLLKSISNYVLVTMEAKGDTFTSLTYFGFDAIIFVLKGRAVIGLVREDKTDRFNLEDGDMMRVAAGTLVYFVNKNENQNLVLAYLFIPLTTPGDYKVHSLILFNSLL
ncbi:hypothetical protein Ahy_B10g103097 isoform B [Arachis hypogaea]|uniref:Uncharacterized protein n=1 Tax=Arachis hypogaea TaxID=3818 RepID=A0A444X3D1_ARAHY|nr:hypothetical protein Ahy_B10g103097 isoform B [Arachis hypogaea]